MSTLLKISETVVNRLKEANEPLAANLYGTFFKNTLVVLGLQVASENQKDEENLFHSFPVEIDLCGIAEVGSEGLSVFQIKHCLADVDITDNPVYISCQTQTGTPQIIAGFIINDNVEVSEYEILSQREINAQFSHIRVQGELPSTSELSVDSIKTAFSNLRTFIVNGKIVFSFPSNNIYLLGNDEENSIINKVGNPSLSDLNSCSEELINERGARKKKNENQEIDIFSIKMLQRVTVDDTPSGKNHGPLCILDKKQCKTINILIPIDALACVHIDTSLLKLYEILVETVLRNIKQYEYALLKHVNSHKESPSEMSALEIFHFHPEECGHFVTKIYPEDINEDELVSERLFLHQKFLIQANKPVFRRSNMFLFPRDSDNSLEILVNPHQGLNPTDNGGEVAIVKGKYKYFHYCQDGMDDNGWGCAYRSLQTLASWYILQGYVNKTVPSYKDIQKCLVDIGDKPANFIGSKQWIGSTEVSFVLETLLGISSRILHVSSGEEMASKGPELLYHFRTQGSPIMIGGGVLAHTILGVDYNKVTGGIKFLILDPHYTGSENLKTIQNKGWCGWKGANFWNKSAYYNMCMPQVPKVI